MVGPDERTIELFTLRGGLYVPVPPGADGRVRSTTAAGLTLDPAEVFADLDD